MIEEVLDWKAADEPRTTYDVWPRIVEAAMQKKYEFLAHDCVMAGTRRLFRIRAVRDFGDVRRGISADISSLRRTSAMRAIAGFTTWRKFTGPGAWCAIMRESGARLGFWAGSMAMRKSATLSWSAKMRMSAGAPLCAVMKSSKARSCWSRNARRFPHSLRCGLAARRFRGTREFGWRQTLISITSDLAVRHQLER